MNKNFLQKIKENWKSGVTVALISLPLSVSLAVASNTSPMVGIITAIWAGLIAAIFGGSNQNVIGPAGALTGIVGAYAIAHGAESLALLSIVSGVFIFIAYLLKLERYMVFIPASTVHGFTLGVGIIIGLGQLNNALGISGLPKHEHFINNVLETLNHLNLASMAALITTIVSIIFLYIFKKYSPKFPGPIVLAPIGILIGYLSTINSLPFSLTTLGAQFPSIKATLFMIPDLSFPPYYGALFTGALAVAIVAILETMLSAKIADTMTGTKHHKRKEMFGLSLANIGSGLAGGMPATGVLVRTSLNARTGATHKTSSAINAIAVALVSFLFIKYFVFIPLPVIAAILIYASINMVETHHFKKMYRLDRTGFVIALIVGFVTVYKDPIIGILLGTAISLLIFVEKISRGQCEVTLNDPGNHMHEVLHGHNLQKLEKDSDTLVYDIKGELVYLNSQSHVARFEHYFKGYKNVILRLRNLHMIDIDGIESLEEIIKIVEGQKKNIYLTGVNPFIFDMMKSSDKFIDLVKEEKVFVKTGDALRTLGYQV